MDRLCKLLSFISSIALTNTLACYVIRTFSIHNVFIVQALGVGYYTSIRLQNLTKLKFLSGDKRSSLGAE
jgi:hypothetical protein